MKTDNWIAAAHNRLRRKNGKASRCENPECKSTNPKRFEWALRKGHSYSDNKEDYIQLCPSCHRKYDYTEEAKLKQRAAKLGKPIYAGGMEKWVKVGIEASKKKVSQYTKDGIYLKTWNSITEACKATGIKNSSISNCISGLSKIAGGYVWKLA